MGALASNAMLVSASSSAPNNDARRSVRATRSGATESAPCNPSTVPDRSTRLPTSIVAVARRRSVHTGVLCLSVRSLAIAVARSEEVTAGVPAAGAESGFGATSSTMRRRSASANRSPVSAASMVRTPWSSVVDVPWNSSADLPEFLRLNLHGQGELHAFAVDPHRVHADAHVRYGCSARSPRRAAPRGTRSWSRPRARNRATRAARRP